MARTRMEYLSVCLVCSYASGIYCLCRLQLLLVPGLLVSGCCYAVALTHTGNEGSVICLTNPSKLIKAQLAVLASPPGRQAGMRGTQGAGL